MTIPRRSWSRRPTSSRSLASTRLSTPPGHTSTLTTRLGSLGPTPLCRVQEADTGKYLRKMCRAFGGTRANRKSITFCSPSFCNGRTSRVGRSSARASHQLFERRMECGRFTLLASVRPTGRWEQAVRRKPTIAALTSCNFGRQFPRIRLWPRRRMPSLPVGLNPRLSDFVEGPHFPCGPICSLPARTS